MEPTSINSRKFLGDYVDAQNAEKFSEALLCSGLLLSGALMAIYCLAGGMFTLVTIVCVLILGSSLGIAWKRYGHYTILSCITGVVSLTPSDKKPMPKAA